MKRVIHVLKLIWKKFVNFLKPNRKISVDFPNSKLKDFPIISGKTENPNVLIVGELQRAGLDIFNIKTQKEFRLGGSIFFDQIYEDRSWISKKILFYGKIGSSTNDDCPDNIRKVFFYFERMNNFYFFKGVAFDFMIEKIRPYFEIISYEKKDEYLNSIKGRIYNSEDLVRFTKTIFDELRQG